MDVLWAPWRMAYVGADAPARGCLFCTAWQEDRVERLVLGTTDAAVVLLNRYPYTSGHLMVAPRRHTASLMALTEPEHAALAETLRRTVAAVSERLHAQGTNVGLNLGAAAGAGIADHLHWHVVPRWHGDTNFMTSIAEARVMPQHLRETYDVLRPAFAWLDAAG
jgi:ATP adenylyltransferase